MTGAVEKRKLCANQPKKPSKKRTPVEKAARNLKERAARAANAELSRNDAANVTYEALRKEMIEEHWLAIWEIMKAGGNFYRLEIYLVEGGFGKRWTARKSTHELSGYQVVVDVQTLEVSVHGKIQRDAEGNTISSTELSAHKDDAGYLQVYPTLPNETGMKKQIHVAIHTLACYTGFGPIPAHKLAISSACSVDHLDRVNTHNFFDNLKWATPSEQSMNQTHTLVPKPSEVFVALEGETTYVYNGHFGFKYTGPDLWVTSHRRIVRDGLVSVASSKSGGYRKIGVMGMKEGDTKPRQYKMKVHLIMFAAMMSSGPVVVLPEVVNHCDHDKDNWDPANLEESNRSRNTTAAHDAGRFVGKRNERQPVIVRTGTGERLQYLSQRDPNTGEQTVLDATFPSMSAAAWALGRQPNNISKSISTKGWFTAATEWVREGDNIKKIRTVKAWASFAAGNADVE